MHSTAIVAATLRAADGKLVGRSSGSRRPQEGCRSLVGALPPCAFGIGAVIEAKLVQFGAPKFQLTTRVLQLNKPACFMYSVVYQNVQSSDQSRWSCSHPSDSHRRSCCR